MVQLKIKEASPPGGGAQDVIKNTDKDNKF